MHLGLVFGGIYSLQVVNPLEHTRALPLIPSDTPAGPFRLLRRFGACDLRNLHLEHQQARSFPPRREAQIRVESGSVTAAAQIRPRGDRPENSHTGIGVRL